jgi:hypothetical protein
MNAFIERDPVTDMVKVWLYSKQTDSTVFMWPEHRDEFGNMIWKQELVPENVERPASVRPAFEMTGLIWQEFVKALHAVELEMPVGKLLGKVLEREQNRVDALISALIKQNEPQFIMTSKPVEGL